MSTYALLLAASLGPYIWPCDISGISASSPCTACTSGQLLKQGASVVECINPASVNVGTATALAANGANCSAGAYPLGVDASGASESCTTVYYQTVENEGSGVTQRATINFTGAGVDCTDSGGKTVCDIAAAAGGGWTDDGTTVRLTTATDSVGIGTVGPATNLEVYESVAGSMGIQANNPNTAGTTNLTLAIGAADYWGVNAYGSTSGGADQNWAVMSTSSAMDGMKLHVDTGDSIISKVAGTNIETITSTGEAIAGGVTATHDATTETSTFDFTANYTAGDQFLVRQQTGNPSGGTLFSVLTNDNDTTIATFTNGGTNGVTINYLGALSKSGTGSVVADEVTCTGCVATTDILNNDVGVADLAASLAFADGDLISLASVNCSGTGEGLILPQAADPSAATAEGQVGWETDVDALWVGTGSSRRPLSWQASHNLLSSNAGGALTPDTTYTTASQAIVLTGNQTLNRKLCFKWSANVVTPTTSAKYRLRDTTNGTTIIEATHAANDFTDEITCTTAAASNMPTGGAEVEVQVAFDVSDAGTINFYRGTWEIE